MQDAHRLVPENPLEDAARCVFSMRTGSPWSIANQARRADAACCISTDSLWRLHRRPVSETLSRSKKSEDRSINESKRLREDWIGDARRPCTRTRRTHPTSSKRLVLGTTGIPLIAIGDSAHSAPKTTPHLSSTIPNSSRSRFPTQTRSCPGTAPTRSLTNSSRFIGASSGCRPKLVGNTSSWTSTVR